MHEVRIAVAAGDVRLEFRGRRAFYEQWIEPLVQAAYRHAGGDAGAAEADPAPLTAAEDEEASFRPSSPVQFHRFVGQVGERASDVDQRIMAFAFYLWNFERKDDFGLEQIAAFFRTVQDEPPRDLPARMGDLSDRRRFIESAGSDDAWRLTTKGVNYVKNRLLA